MAQKFIIAIDLGGTNLKVALLDLKYKIKDKRILNTQRFKNRAKLIAAIITSVDKIIEDNYLTKKNILGLGIGLAGLIDTNKGIVHFLPNISGWREVNLKSILEKKLKLPVILDNDVKLMALAEYKLGSARGTNNAFCLTLGTGVGGGIILDGKLYRGSDNATGEIGHIPINEVGPSCSCGGNACLEAYIGNNRIRQKARRLFGRNISLEELSLLARRKNKRALAIWSEVGIRLGIALTSVVNLLNLDTIVIGGGVANAGSFLFDKVRQTIKKRAMSVQAKRVKVCKAKLGFDSGLIGAAILVSQRAMVCLPIGKAISRQRAMAWHPIAKTIKERH